MTNPPAPGQGLAALRHHLSRLGRPGPHFHIPSPHPEPAPDSSTEPTPTQGQTGPLFGPFGLAALGLAIGLGLGLMELGLLLVRHHLYDAATLGALQLNRHFLWMVPTANVALFTPVGLALALLWPLRPRLVARLGFSLLVALACLTLLLTIHGLYPLAAALLAFGLAALLAPRLAALPHRLRRLIALGLPVELALFAGLFAFDWYSVSQSEPRALAQLPPVRTDAPNLLFIVLDTVRADRLSLYGYSRETTPHLASLARRGFTFEHARAPSPWTLPSHATLFTGRWPHELKVDKSHPLAESWPTLAEHLHSLGYVTAGFVANLYFCNSWYGLDQGFVHYEDYPERDTVSFFEILRNAELGQRLLNLSCSTFHTRPGVIGARKHGEQVNRDAVAWLDTHLQHRDGRPFFVFLNYLDTHDPYVLPPGEHPHFDLAPQSPEDFLKLQAWHAAPKDTLSDRDRALASDAYDDCLAYLDQQLGQLFANLEKRGVLDHTLVVVTADHGEHFGEHGLYLHANSLYRPLVDVPLVIVPPGARRLKSPSRIAEPVSLRDVPATVLDLLGVAADSGKSHLPGTSLSWTWDPSRPRPDPSSASLLLSSAGLKINALPSQRQWTVNPLQFGPMHSLQSGSHVYIRLGNGHEELYDLATDPAESHNLAAERSQRPLIDKFRSSLARALSTGASGESRGEAAVRRALAADLGVYGETGDSQGARKPDGTRGRQTPGDLREISEGTELEPLAAGHVTEEDHPRPAAPTAPKK